MKNKKLVVLGATFCAAVVGVVASTALAARPIGGGGGPIYCLDVWRPVICSNGVVYSNDCYARRAGATGCVPYPGDTR